jgi:shikimate dehydrogenase
MGVRYAEVIGDPVAHSKSPLIHKFWLEKSGLQGEFRAWRCTAAELPSFLSGRCADPFWRGCSVTRPLKQAAARVAPDPFGLCGRIGAANAVFRSPLGCGVGANTDVVGIAAALGDFVPKRVCVIGAGGAARAALECLRLRGVADLALVARTPALLGPESSRGFDEIRAAMANADCVVNATPLGMAGEAEMPDHALGALAATDQNALVVDLVYSPLDTPLLRRARELGRRTADGLVALVGQAAPAFELFFGAPAPREHDLELRELLTS